MITTVFGALILFIPLLLIGAWFMFNRYRPVFWMYLGAVVIGLGYLATTGTLQSVGQPIYNLVYGPTDAVIEPAATPAAETPVAAPEPAATPDVETVPAPANDNTPEATDGAVSEPSDDVPSDTLPGDETPQTEPDTGTDNGSVDDAPASQAN